MSRLAAEPLGDVYPLSHWPTFSRRATGRRLNPEDRRRPAARLLNSTFSTKTNINTTTPLKWLRYSSSVLPDTLAIPSPRPSLVRGTRCSSHEKIAELAKDEITGVVGEATKPETWGAAASSASIVVDLSRDDQNEAPLATAVLEGVTRIAKQTGRKITFIYTSCSWTYGKRSPGITEEDDICDTPDELVWCAEHKQNVVQSTDLRGVVLVPTAIYGRSGSQFGKMISLRLRVKLWGDGSLRLPVVHVDDLGRSDGAFVWWRQVPNLKLPTSYKYCFHPISSTSIYSTAEAYVSAAENIDRTSSEIINVANPSTESIGEASRAALLAAGHPKGQVIFSPPTNWIEEKLTWSLHLLTRKAANLLGFRQKHPGLWTEWKLITGPGRLIKLSLG
ncbi:hypothetical protein BC938DRAFT_472783 [Jimgerdemannia flammicorona]|uniref:NAD-dependent epimerase/dehydratase domain-containing protein n=1 Tax=Jimgerdemannia flammicorona TaxID=994334 RepID=A0A433QTQ6_9FUNG|nr:hypothetical protein BC938DRAFT_472783 [Jimgerdemannia flammicorona]